MVSTIQWNLYKQAITIRRSLVAGVECSAEELSMVDVECGRMLEVSEEDNLLGRISVCNSGLCY